MGMDDLKTMLIERRDELETELATIGAMLEVLSPEKPERQERKRRPRLKPPKGKGRRHKPSERVRNKILDYFKDNPGPARTRTVAAAIGVSTGSTGKSLRVMAEDGDIEFAGSDKGKGYVPLYKAREQGPEHERGRPEKPDASGALVGIGQDRETIQRLDTYPTG